MAATEKTDQRKRIEKRENDITTAAALLFSEHGFHATSTRKIAAQAGVSEGTLFHYYATKTELLRAILGRFYERLTEGANKVIRREFSTRVRLQLMAENHITLLADNRALFMRLVQVYMSHDLRLLEHLQGSPLYELNYNYTRVFDLVVKEGMQRGDIRSDINLAACRDLFFGGLEYGMRTLLLRNQIDALEDYVHTLIEPLWQSMQATRPIPPANADRIEKVCERIEAVAHKLERAGP